MMGADMDVYVGSLPLHPAWQLAWALVLGLALGLLFDIYRVGFGTIKGKIWQNLADLFWWTLALILFVLAMYRINGLQIRGFELALTAGGVLAEQLWFSAHFTPLCARFVAWGVRLLRGLLRLAARLVELILTPAVWILGLILALFGRIKRLICAILGLIWRVTGWGTGPIRRGIGRIWRGLVGSLQGVWRRADADIPDDKHDDEADKNVVES